MLGKWSWSFGVERDTVWRKVVVAKYGAISNYEPKDVKEGYGVGNWKVIVKVSLSFGATSNWGWVWDLVEKIKVWKDRWCCVSSLKELFSLAWEKLGIIYQHYVGSGGNGGWNFKLRRNLND